MTASLPPVVGELVAVAEALWGSQERCDEDGTMVAVSRQAVNEIVQSVRELATLSALTAEAVMVESVIAMGGDGSLTRLEIDSVDVTANGLRVMVLHTPRTAEAGKGEDKARAFKDYTHGRLDAMGVPHSVPESEHDKAGCRIGGRLDWVEQRLALSTATPAGEWRDAMLHEGVPASVANSVVALVTENKANGHD
jgi:hypothetical protein